MKKYVFLWLVILASTSKLMANDDFREGYLIDNANDTTWGFIHYQGVFQESRVCLFRAEPNARTKAYFPRDLKAFRFTGSRYFLSKEIQNGVKKDTVFMEYLLNGIVSLYSYYDNGALRYFANTQEDSLLELEIQDKIVYVNGKRFLKEDKRYIGILKFLFSKSPSIMQRVETMDLTQKGLVGVAHDYHQEVCDGEACIIYEKSLKPTNDRFQFGPMVNLTTYSFKNLEQTDHSLWPWQYSTFNKTVFPAVGLFLKKNLPRIHDRLFLQYEGLYAHDQLFGKKKNYAFGGFTYYDCIHDKRDFIQNSMLLKREYDVGTIDWYWNAGAFLDVAIRTDYSHTLEKWDAQDKIVGEPSIVDRENPFANNEAGLLAGIGLVFPFSTKWGCFMDLRYRYGLGTRGLSPDYTTKSYLSLNLGLAFGK
jgi:hypothetical protein